MRCMHDRTYCRIVGAMYACVFVCTHVCLYVFLCVVVLYRNSNSCRVMGCNLDGGNATRCAVM